MKATRVAYGEALAEFGNTYQEVVSLDAETKNSTFAEIFQQAHPERYFDCFIAEQNMIAMAVGMARIGKIPFASSFAAFLTRAYDQIRMAGLGESNIKIVGSHAGVSIGDDGSSQMALEDLAMMRSVWNSCVLYPSDPVATEKLVEKMIKRNGLCYMRTTRAATETIYDNDEAFPIGGFKLHKSNNKPKVTVISAGITLHEALKLQSKQDLDVIDLYSIKPIDEENLKKAIRTNNILTVEDHWIEGGLGDAVLGVFSNEADVVVKKHAVTSLPHSGKPEETLARAGIDTAGIEKALDIFLG